MFLSSEEDEKEELIPSSEERSRGIATGAKLELMGGGCRVHTTSSRYSDSYSHSITNPQFLTSKLNFNNGNIILVTSQYIIHTQIGGG